MRHWFDSNGSAMQKINAKFKLTPVSISVIALIPMTYKMHPAVKDTVTGFEVLSHWFDSNGLAVRESISNVNPFWI